jgi:hypothetical protein
VHCSVSTEIKWQSELRDIHLKMAVRSCYDRFLWCVEKMNDLLDFVRFCLTVKERINIMATSHTLGS